MPRPSNLLYLLTLSTFNPTAHAFWRAACSVVQTGRIDPILSPDTISGHVHKIAGGNEVNPYSTYDSLQTSNCSSCEIQADKSAYWTPQLYYAHSNGTFEEVPNYGMTVYYVGEQEGIRCGDRAYRNTRSWTKYHNHGAFPRGLPGQWHVLACTGGY
jgi:hypothetical protein